MPEQAHAVTASRLLDLDHLGTEVGEQRACPRPGHHLAHLDDGEPLQWPWHAAHRTPMALSAWAVRRAAA